MANSIDRSSRMWAVLVGVLGLCWAAALPGPLWAQVTTAWVVESGPSRYGKAIAVDGVGNVYVAGRSVDAVSGNDYVVLKYDTQGSQLWSATYSGPGANDDIAVAIGVDAAGNVYVAGSSVGSGTAADYAIVKYTPAGVQEWVVRFDGLTGGADTLNAMLVHPSGTVYVTGSTQMSPSNYDMMTIAYDSAGTLLWSAQYDGPGNGIDSGNTIGLDSSGNVYVSGHSIGIGTGYDWATILYSPNGSQMWVARYNGPAGADDFAGDLVVDPAGGVVVTGASTGIGTGRDYTTIAYDAAGSELWVSHFDGPAHAGDAAVAVGRDSAGNITVTGSSTISVNGPIGSDYMTVKYSPTGSQLWAVRYNGTFSSTDTPTGLVVDAEGNSYVTGKSLGNSFDYATIRYDANGNQVWVQRYHSAGNTTQEEAEAIALDSQGSVYVTGTDGSVITTIKYVQSADLSLTKVEQQDPIVEGQRLVYTLSVMNNGPGRATGVTVVDTLPTTVTFQSANASQGSCSTSGQVIQCSLGVLAANAGATITITANSTQQGTVTNTATVSAVEYDPVPGNNQASATTTILPPATLYPLTVTKAGTGTGTVTSSPSGIFCGANCSAEFAAGTVVTLTATADSGSFFSGWSGDADCSDGAVTMTGPRACTATFVPIGQTHTLTLTTAGAGFGAVAGAGTYAYGATATVSATAYTGSVFVAWSGPNAAECAAGSVAMVANKSCTATFELKGKLTSISTRARVGTGDERMIAGFIVGGGTVDKRVLIRARGPSMSGAPFNLSTALANPYVRLHSAGAGAYIAQNDNWGNQSDPLCASSGYACGTPAEISATGMDPCAPNPGQTVAPPGCANESALLITLPAGSYTAVVSGVGGATGVGLVEVFEVAP